MNADLPDYSRSRAILIGTSNYQDPQYPPLPAVTNSLRGLREVLIDPGLCGWPADRTTVLEDPADVRKLVQSLRRLARETADVLLVYFVGHGTIVRRGQLCLVLSDTDAGDPDITGLEFERVREALLDSPARTKIVILDCCYSGRAIEAMSDSAAVADSTDTHGVYTLTASDHAAHVVALDQQASATTSFTGELLDLIRTGIPGGPDTLPLNLIYLHLRRQLQARQLPAPNQRGTDMADRYAFTRNATVTRHTTVSQHTTVSRADTVHAPVAPLLPAPLVPAAPAPDVTNAVREMMGQPQPRTDRQTRPRLGPVAALLTGGLTVLLAVLILAMSGSEAKVRLIGLQMIIYGVFRMVQFFAADDVPGPPARTVLRDPRRGIAGRRNHRPVERAGRLLRSAEKGVCSVLDRRRARRDPFRDQGRLPSRPQAGDPLRRARERGRLACRRHHQRHAGRPSPRTEHFPRDLAAPTRGYRHRHRRQATQRGTATTTRGFGSPAYARQAVVQSCRDRLPRPLDGR